MKHTTKTHVWAGPHGELHLTAWKESKLTQTIPHRRNRRIPMNLLVAAPWGFARAIKRTWRLWRSGQ